MNRDEDIFLQVSCGFHSPSLSLSLTQHSKPRIHQQIQQRNCIKNSKQLKESHKFERFLLFFFLYRREMCVPTSSPKQAPQKAPTTMIFFEYFTLSSPPQQFSTTGSVFPFSR